MDGASLRELALWSLSRGAGAVWLLPVHGARPSTLHDSSLVRNFATNARATLIQARKGQDQDLDWHELTAGRAGAALSGLVAQRRREDGSRYGIPLGIYAPWVGDAWGLNASIAALEPSSIPTAGARALAFATGLALAAHAYGVQLRFSPSYAGMVALRQVLERWEKNSKREFPQPSQEFRDLLCETPGMLPTYLAWRAPSLLDQRAQFSGPGTLAGTCLYVYDRNSSFPSSARTIPLGDPIPTRRSEWHAHRPGVYRVSQLQAPAGWPDSLPGPFHVGDGIGTYPHQLEPGQLVWVWEPQLRLAQAHGWAFQVEGGYFWPASQSTMDLKPWHDRFWTARAVVQSSQVQPPSKRIAKTLVKKMGSATIGRLLQHKGHALVNIDQAQEQGLDILAYETDQQGQFTGLVEAETDLGRADLNQPAIWAYIIAHANERLQNWIWTHAPDSCLAYVDAAYTVQPHQAAQDPLKPGAFREAGIILLEPEDWQRLDQQPADQLVKSLAALPHGTTWDQGDVISDDALGLLGPDPEMVEA